MAIKGAGLGDRMFLNIFCTHTHHLQKNVAQIEEKLKNPFAAGSKMFL